MTKWEKFADLCGEIAYIVTYAVLLVGGLALLKLWVITPAAEAIFR